MKSPIIKYTTRIGILLLLIVTFFGLGRAAPRNQAKPRTDGGIASKTGAACNLILLWDANYIPAPGETRTVTVNNVQLCSWTAVASASWIKVTPSSGSAIFTVVSVKVEPNYGPWRYGSVNFSGKTIGVNQAPGDCFYTFASDSKTFPSGGTTQVASLWVTASDGFCPRSGVATKSWINIVDGDKLWGSGPILYTVEPNIGPARIGSISFGPYYFNIHQESGCTYAFSESSRHYSSSGTGATTPHVAVEKSHTSCPINVTSNAAWLTTAGGGNTQVLYNVAANQGPARTGKITIGKATLTITQDGGCGYSFNSQAKAFDSGGGSGSINVTASESDCPRNATSNSLTHRPECSG